MARPISRSVLSFGLVSIPVELYPAIEDHNIHFHLLHKKCGSRVRHQIFCPFCKVVIERDETVRGYEVTKGQYVRVKDAELEALEAEAKQHRSSRIHPDRKGRPDLFREQLLSRARQRGR